MATARIAFHSFSSGSVTINIKVDSGDPSGPITLPVPTIISNNGVVNLPNTDNPTPFNGIHSITVVGDAEHTKPAPGDSPLLRHPNGSTFSTLWSTVNSSPQLVVILDSSILDGGKNG